MDAWWCQFAEMAAWEEEVWGRARAEKWRLKCPSEKAGRLHRELWMETEIWMFPVYKQWLKPKKTGNHLMRGPNG